MDFNLPVDAFVHKYFASKALKGHEKFLVATAVASKGDLSSSLGISDVKLRWTKGVFGIKYHPTYKATAQKEGWVKPVANGKYKITQTGLDFLTRVSNFGEEGGLEPGETRLRIFLSGKTHDFDKFLRTTFASVVTDVRIADSYVDETIFDNLLDEIPTTAKVQLLYGNAWGNFKPRVKRFKTQFPNFKEKNYTTLHDRFLIVDGIGYILGPSLKDAARKSPALVVELSADETKKLVKFFDNMWSQVK